MLIDIVFLVIVVIAAIRGIQRGFIIAVFSVIAIIIGLAAAIKLSTVAADYLDDSVSVSAKWLPVISFIIVFLLFVLAVRLIANILQKTVEIAFLGWANRIAGAILYIFLYTIVFSIVLFFAGHLTLIKAETIADSKVYPWVEPIGPYIINGIGKVAPFFRDMFEQLKAFFESMSRQVEAR
jgi:membrane protein required for colicin V production